jgi:hypothetical protein
MNEDDEGRGAGEGASWGRPIERIPMLLAALERVWADEPDTRLGQLVMNLLRANTSVSREEEGRVLFNVEDGQLLAWLGPETKAEQAYIAEEPRRAREGWRAWEKAWRESDAYKEWRQRWARPPGES